MICVVVKKAFSTLRDVLAEVSKKRRLFFFAKICPSSKVTSLLNYIKTGHLLLKKRSKALTRSPNRSCFQRGWWSSWSKHFPSSLRSTSPDCQKSLSSWHRTPAAPLSTPCNSSSLSIWMTPVQPINCSSFICIFRYCVPNLQLYVLTPSLDSSWTEFDAYGQIMRSFEALVCKLQKKTGLAHA